MAQDVDRPVDDTSRIGLVIGCIVGVPMMLVGIVGILRHTDATPPSSYLRFFIGGDIVHDAIIAPIAALIAYLVIRRVPRITRAPLRAFLFGTAVVVAVAWPGIRMYGRMRAPDNATVQPLNYATATLTAVGIVAAIAAVWLACALVRQHRTRERSQRIPSSDP